MSFSPLSQSVSQLSQFSCSVMSDSVNPRTAACQASLAITNSWSLLKRMSIELVMPCNLLILCCPLLLLPSIFPSIRVFSSESVLPIRWPKYWSFSFTISPSNEYSGLISFKIDWFALPAVQGTLKSLLQHQSSKASIFPCSVISQVNTYHSSKGLIKNFFYITQPLFLQKYFHLLLFHSCIHCCLVLKSCPALCDLMNRSMPGLPVHHHLLESTQTHIHRVRDAIQPSHPLSSPSPPAPNPSQDQGLFQ